MAKSMTPDIDIDHDEFYEDQFDTRASTLGALPDPIGLVLLALVFAGFLGIGSAIGYPVRLLTVLFTTGLVAAVAVRIASTSRTGYVLGGVALLWTAAVAFTVGTVLLIVQMSSVIGSVFLPLLIASAALLAPFSILGSTIQSFGHGAARSVLSRYLTGTLLLTGLIIVLLVSGVLKAVVTSVLAGAFTAVTGETFTGIGVHARAFGTVFLYAGVLYIGRRVIHALPFEVFVPPRKFDRLTRIRELADRIHRYGLVAVGVYFCLTVVAFIFTRGDPHPVGELATAVTTIGAARPVVLVALFAAVGGGIVLFIVGVTDRLTRVSGLAMVETVVPPVALVVLTTVVTTVAGDRIATTVLDAAPGSGIEPGGVLYQLITGQPSVVVLVLVTAALLASAVVLSLPSILARLGPGDASLTGIGTGVLGVITLVVVAVLAQARFEIIVGGVVLAAIVWELGEYSTVAAGELTAPDRGAATPDGFTAAVAVHSVATTFVAVVAVGSAAAAVLIFGGATLSIPTAAVGLLLASLALAVLINLLTG